MIAALIHQKGGVGKSTLTVSLAVEAAGRGQAVLIVDADPQRTVSTWADVRTARRDQLLRTGRLPDEAIAVEPAELATLQPALRVGEADLVLIDCPPRHSEVQAAVLLAADLALVPCGPTAADAWAIAETLALVAEAAAGRPPDRPLRAAIVLNRTRVRSAVRSTRQALAEAGVPVFDTEVGDRLPYQEALAAGKGITTYAPSSVGAAEIRALFDEILSVMEDRAHVRQACL